MQTQYTYREKNHPPSVVSFYFFYKASLCYVCGFFSTFILKYKRHKQIRHWISFKKKFNVLFKKSALLECWYDWYWLSRTFRLLAAPNLTLKIKGGGDFTREVLQAWHKSVKTQMSPPKKKTHAKEKQLPPNSSNHPRVRKATPPPSPGQSSISGVEALYGELRFIHTKANLQPTGFWLTSDFKIGIWDHAVSMIPDHV